MGLPWRDGRRDGRQGYAATGSRLTPSDLGCSETPGVRVPPIPALSSAPVLEDSRKNKDTGGNRGPNFTSVDPLKLTGPSKAFLSVVSSYRMQPKAQISDFLAYGFPSQISGEM